MEQHLKEEGEKACFEVGVHGLHPELVKLVGRMKYRTSYGQNCLQHSKEVAWLAGMMAAEIGADVKLAKRMRPAPRHRQGADPRAGGAATPSCRCRCSRSTTSRGQVINAALCGPREQEAETIEAVLVEAADGISAARPGARRDVLESYIKRLQGWRRSRTRYKGVDAPTRSRPAASCGSSPRPTWSPTSTPTSSPRTSPSGSRPRCSTPATSRWS